MLPSLLLVLLAACLLPAPSSASSTLRPRGTCCTNRALPIPPKQDPWYTAPDNFASAAPGAILRMRLAPGNLTCLIGNSSAAYNILYRTTDSQYKPTWAVTTLFVPTQPNDKALLSYQIPYDSANVDASPSYLLYSNPQADIGRALGLGWYVVVPDYEGPLASFTAGVMSGHATIDSVRAALSLGWLKPDAKYATWGYSGGAIAGEWAAELQVQYAPEMAFAGAALGGLTPNITSVLEAVDGTPFAGLIPAAMLGLASQFPDTLAYLKSQLYTEGPYNQTGFLAALNETLAQAEIAFVLQNIWNYFAPGASLLQAPLVQRAIDSDGLMGYHGVPTTPLFVYKAINDELSHIGETDSLVEKYCSVGASIKYDRNTVGGHQAEEINGLPRALEWLAAVLSGTYSATGCTVQDVTVNITSSPLRRRWAHLA